MNITHNTPTFHNTSTPQNQEERRNALIKYIAKELKKGKTQEEIAAETAGLTQVQVSEIEREAIRRRRVLTHGNNQFHANLNDEVIQAAGFNPKQRLYFDVETDEEEGKIILDVSKDKVEIEEEVK